jgi:glyoxylase-like metal-dependent hydrolase (beta-lactamase superfamily II)
MHVLRWSTLLRFSAGVPLAAALCPSALHAQHQTLEVATIADGVYGSIYSEMKRDPVESNSMFVIGSTGVLVVDASYTPAGARKTIAAIRQLTTLPVRYVVTTHWHDDHVFGNQAYRDAFPGVQFIAHAQTRDLMAKFIVPHRDELIAAYGRGVPRIEDRLARKVDSAGTPLTEDYLSTLRQLYPGYRAFLESVRTVELVLPTITFEKELTVYLDDREIRISNFGSGNTEGDAVIYLPKEGIVAVGDLVVFPVPYIYGGFPDEWSKLMQTVKGLGATTIVPGHGPVMRDWSYFDLVTEMLASLATQVRDAVARGMTLEDTRKAVNLDSFRSRFLEGSPDDRLGTWNASIMSSGIESAYEEATAAKAKR